MIGSFAITGIGIFLPPRPFFSTDRCPQQSHFPRCEICELSPSQNRPHSSPYSWHFHDNWSARNTIRQPGEKKRLTSEGIFNGQHLTGFVQNLPPLLHRAAAADRWATRLSKRADLLNPFSYRDRSEKTGFKEGIGSPNTRAGARKSYMHFPQTRNSAKSPYATRSTYPKQEWLAAPLLAS